MGWMDKAGITGPMSDNSDPGVTDLGPEGRRARAGKPPEPRAKTDAELGIERGPVVAYEGSGHEHIDGKVVPTRPGQPVLPGTPIVGGTPLQHGFTDNEMAQDPLAQAVVAAPLAAGAAALVGGGAAAAGAPALAARVLGGAAGGSTAAVVTGEDPAVGAAVGAGAPLLGAAAAKVLAPWARGAAQRVADRVVTEWGQAAKGAGKTVTQGKLAGLDAQTVASTLEKNGIALSGQSAAEAQAAQKAALARTGQELAAARDAIDAADPARRTLGEAMDSVDKTIDGLRKGPQADKPLADALHTWAKDFFDANGADKAAQMSVADLSKAVSSLEAKGYAGLGNTLSPAAAKKAARLAARALDDMIDEHVAAVAAKSPAAQQAAAQIADKTAEFRVLKTVEPIVSSRATAERFAPSAAQRFAAAPGQVIKNAGAAVVASPVRAAVGSVRLADVALARLFAAKAAGQVTPELIDAATKAGVSQPVLQHFLRPAHEGAP
jgi:hypothetical protein